MAIGLDRVAKDVLRHSAARHMIPAEAGRSRPQIAVCPRRYGTTTDSRSPG